MAVFSISTKRISRPEGYQYPIGLNTIDQSSTVNIATNTTGGTQTVDGRDLSVDGA